MAKKKCFGNYNGRSEECVRCNNFDCICETSLNEDLPPVALLKKKIAERAIRVSTVTAVPHTYMKAVSIEELDKIIEEVFSDGS